MNSSLLGHFRHKGRAFHQCKHFLKHYSSTADQTVIPKRIKRGPTDILRALANTVPKDPTAPHYKYHDDPYLIPYSNSSKRSYALAQEAGRKAAQWIRQEHKDLFQHKVAEPPIEAFIPKPTYDENSNVNEEDLKLAINKIWTPDAIHIYKLLKEKGIEVSRDGKQSLLELLCYYNEMDSMDENWIEERWFRKGTKNKNLPKKTWKDNGIAEQLFNELKPADSRSYSAIISGMCNYGQLDKAWNLYQESVEKNISINVTAYNALISRVNFMKESHDLMWKLVEELLSSMNQRRLRPNVGTLNAVLESLSIMSANRNSKENALRAIAEFKQFGIEPTLASYYHLLNIFCREKGRKSGILIDIIRHLEGKEFKVVDIKDSLFFTRAMEVCRNHLHDKDLAYRIDQLLHWKDNYNLIGDSYRESNYYRYIFTLLCETEPLDVFMSFYETLVPNVYIPEPSVMLEVLSAIEANADWHYLPKMWSDMVMFDHTDRENLLEKILNCASKSMEESLLTQMNQIGWDVWEKIEGQTRERAAIEWSGKMLSDLLMIFINTDDIVKASIVVNKLQKSQNQIIGEPDILPLQLFVDFCVEKDSIDHAIKCIRYCHDIGFIETNSMAKKLVSSTELSEKNLELLDNIVGKELTKKTEEASR